MHFGSLVAAVGSFLQARSRGGEWLLRIDDLDTPRVVAGAADQILRALDAFGLQWDGELVWQNDRRDHYEQAMERLRGSGAAYPCACTRRDLKTRADGSRFYPGHCRDGIADGREPRSERVRCEGVTIRFEDCIQGPVMEDLGEGGGDFLVRRAGGLHAYHLAVVVDDAADGITEVVRGADLLPSTPGQIHLQRLLGLPTPRYCHLPVALGSRGDKLSKQTHALALDLEHPLPTLMRALRFLGQDPPDELGDTTLAMVWDWAIDHWRMQRVPTVVPTPIYQEFES